MLSNTLNVVANELLLTQLINEITQVCREINVLELRTRFSNVLSLYEIKPIGSAPQFQSDLEDKIALFLASKQLEGLSKVTLDGYKIELRLFAKHIQKPIEQITTADIRAYLGQFPHSFKAALTYPKDSIIKRSFDRYVQ